MFVRVLIGAALFATLGLASAAQAQPDGWRTWDHQDSYDDEAPRRAPSRPAALEPDVLAAVNFARTHPHDYAEHLRDGSEMTAATEEAIADLESRRPMAPLAPSPELAASAGRHAEDQGEHDAFAHDGTDGSSAGERMHRAGVWAGMLAEVMSAGMESGDAVVRQLIVDEDVPSRGHRKDLLDPFLTRAGVGCAPHPTYRVICVIDLASAPPPR